MNSPTDLATLRAPKEASMPAVRAGFFDLNAFELIQRVSKAFAGSDLVPKQYQGNLANCMIAMDMAQRIGANPLMVMQNLYIVHGTPGWSSKFLIATINASGRYSSLRYEWKGKPGEPGYGCRAWAIERATGERLDGIWVTWEMVRAEGWDAKNGSKWKTMPDQMFVYRSASFWQRAYAPELGMGLQTAEEIHDVFDAGKGSDGRYEVDIDSLRSSGQVDTETGEITTPPGQIEHQPPAQTIPQQTRQADTADQWRPDPEEEAAIRARELAESQRGAQPAARPRRERGGLGLE
jgi:hypothetical protein